MFNKLSKCDLWRLFDYYHEKHSHQTFPDTKLEKALHCA